MGYPDSMRLGQLSDPLYFEYLRRTQKFNMTVNHFHPYYEIYYLISGERMYFVKDTSYHVRAGDLVLINKDELHQTLDAGKPAHERLIIHFDDRYLRHLQHEHAELLLSPFRQPSALLVLPAEERAMVRSHIDRTLLELSEKPVGCEIYLTGVLTDILLLAARHVQQHQPAETEHVSPKSKKISEVVRFLNASFAEPMQLQTIADRFFISPYYLSRMFKEVTGFTLIDYLNLTRIREAQRLLRETDMKITDVAAAVGFDNFSHFGKTFRKIAHSSARQYRQTYGRRK